MTRRPQKLFSTSDKWKGIIFTWFLPREVSFGSKNSLKAKKGKKGQQRLLKANKGQNERKCYFKYLSKVKTLLVYHFRLLKIRFDVLIYNRQKTFKRPLILSDFSFHFRSSTSGIWESNLMYRNIFLNIQCNEKIFLMLIFIPDFVIKHHIQWSISIYEKPFLTCNGYPISMAIELFLFLRSLIATW